MSGKINEFLDQAHELAEFRRRHDSEYSKIAGQSIEKINLVKSKPDGDVPYTKHIQRTTLENGVIKNQLVGLQKGSGKGARWLFKNRGDL